MVRCCPRATRMMERVLYLPITSQDLGVGEMERLVGALVECTSGEDDNGGRDRNGAGLQNGTDGRRGGYTTTVVLCVSLLLIDCCTFHSLPIRIVDVLRLLFYILRSLAPVAVAAAGAGLLFLHVLRVTMGPYYVDSSSTFAKYSATLSRHDDGADPSVTGGLRVPTALGDDFEPIAGGAEEEVEVEDLFETKALRVPDLRTAHPSQTADGAVEGCGVTPLVRQLDHYSYCFDIMIGD